MTFFVLSVLQIVSIGAYRKNRPCLPTLPKEVAAQAHTWGYLFCTGQIVQQITVLLMGLDLVIADGLKLTLYGIEGCIKSFVSVSRPCKCLLKDG